MAPSFSILRYNNLKDTTTLQTYPPPYKNLFTSPSPTPHTKPFYRRNNRPPPPSGNTTFNLPPPATISAPMSRRNRVELKPKPPDLELVNPDLQYKPPNLVFPSLDIQKLDAEVKLVGVWSSPEKSFGAELVHVKVFEEEPTAAFELVVKSLWKHSICDPFWSSVCEEQVVPFLHRVAELVEALGFSESGISPGHVIGLNVLNGAGLQGMGLRGAGGLDKGELDFVLPLPRRPPDPSIAVVNLSFCCICSLGPESRPLVITIYLYCLLMILYPHEAQFQALRDLVFCPPPMVLFWIDPVAFYAWGCLPIFGSGKGIEVRTGWFYVDWGPRYSDLFSPLAV